MTKSEELAEARVSEVYDYLQDSGIIEEDAGDVDQRAVVDEKLADYALKLEAYHAGQKTPGPLTLDQNRLEYLRDYYIEGEDEAGLHSFIHKKRWTRHSDVSRVAYAALAKYVKVHRELGRRQNTEHQDLELSLSPEEYRDLEETIQTKIDEGKMVRSFGGSLFLLMGKREDRAMNFPARQREVATQQAAALLRIRISRFDAPEDMDRRAVKGIEYLEQILGQSYRSIRSVDSIVFESEMKKTSGETDITEQKRKIETYIALAIEELFP